MFISLHSLPSTKNILYIICDNLKPKPHGHSLFDGNKANKKMFDGAIPGASSTLCSFTWALKDNLKSQLSKANELNPSKTWRTVQVPWLITLL